MSVMHAAMSVDEIASEIRAMVNTVDNAIVMRREHPTYGYTKVGTTGDFCRLQGMLYVYAMVVFGDHSANRYAQAQKAAEHLDVDLTALALRVKNC